MLVRRLPLSRVIRGLSHRSRSVAHSDTTTPRPLNPPHSTTPDHIRVLLPSLVGLHPRYLDSGSVRLQEPLQKDSFSSEWSGKRPLHLAVGSRAVRSKHALVYYAFSFTIPIGSTALDVLRGLQGAGAAIIIPLL